MRIQELFQKPLSRSINGVVKADQRPWRFSELESTLDVASNTLHYHLDALVDVGLIENRKRTEPTSSGLHSYYRATSLGEGILEGVHRSWGAVPTGPRRTAYDSDIRRAAGEHMPNGWDWRILKAMIHQESGFSSEARSSRGALGLGQIMPATGRGMGYNSSDLLNAETNLAAAAEYLREQWDRWKGVPDKPSEWQRTRFALAAYNAGPYRVKRILRGLDSKEWKKLRSRLPSETQHYVSRIMDELYPAYCRVHFGYAVGVFPPR